MCITEKTILSSLHITKKYHSLSPLGQFKTMVHKQLSGYNEKSVF